MTNLQFRHTFHKSVREAISLKVYSEGYIVNTPFMFPDGDHYIILLKPAMDAGVLSATEWRLSDEGHTLMHVSFENSALTAAQRSRLHKTLTVHGVDCSWGELTMPVRDGAFGEALCAFIQAISGVVGATWPSMRD